MYAMKINEYHLKTTVTVTTSSEEHDGRYYCDRCGLHYDGDDWSKVTVWRVESAFLVDDCADCSAEYDDALCHNGYYTSEPKVVETTLWRCGGGCYYHDTDAPEPCECDDDHYSDDTEVSDEVEFDAQVWECGECGEDFDPADYLQDLASDGEEYDGNSANEHVRSLAAACCV